MGIGFEPQMQHGRNTDRHEGRQFRQVEKTPRIPAFLRGVGSSDEWYTPPALIKSLGEFDLDPACGPLCENQTARTRYGTDGLSREWFGRVWLNPPFSDAMPWVDKLVAHGNGILLVFSRSDAVWYQRAVASAGGCFLLKGRIQFQRPGGGPSRCPLGCSLIPFGTANHEAIRASGLDGIFLKTA